MKEINTKLMVEANYKSNFGEELSYEEIINKFSDKNADGDPEYINTYINSEMLGSIIKIDRGSIPYIPNTSLFNVMKFENHIQINIFSGNPIEVNSRTINGLQVMTTFDSDCTPSIILNKRKHYIVFNVLNTNMISKTDVVPNLIAKLNIKYLECGQLFQLKKKIDLGKLINLDVSPIEDILKSLTNIVKVDIDIDVDTSSIEGLSSKKVRVSLIETTCEIESLIKKKIINKYKMEVTKLK